MTDAPERIALRWTEGAAITSGPLMDHPEYTRYVRADLIEELEERLKAATDDAKEAEAYAEEIYAHAKELEAQIAAMEEGLTAVHMAGYMDGRKAAEAKLGKAVKVLERIATHDTQAWAIKALAELTGGKDE